MPTFRTKTFRDADGQAVLLPDELAYDTDGLDLVVVRSGDVVTIYPEKPLAPIAEMLARLRALPIPDKIEERDVEELPERPGL